MTEAKKKYRYIGLWVGQDKNGNPYLSGKDKETGIKYFVFSDDKTKEKRLCSSKEGEKIVTIGKVEKKTNDRGEFMVCEGHIIIENRFYEEGTFTTASGAEYTKPEYNLGIPN